MGTVRIAYATIEGQTRAIAEFIGCVVRDRGHVADVDVLRPGEALVGTFDAVIVGASVHMGRHDKRLVQYLHANHGALAVVPSAFFSVSLAAHGDVGEARRYVSELLDETGWQPDEVALVGGALLYTRYGVIKRRLMRRIAQDKPGQLDTDMSRDHVYTDWDAVQRFTESFASRVPALRR